MKILPRIHEKHIGVESVISVRINRRSVAKLAPSADKQREQARVKLKATMRKPIPEMSWNVQTMTFNLPKSTVLGIRKKSDLILNIQSMSPVRGILQRGDIIFMINNVPTDGTETPYKTIKPGQNTIKVIRLATRAKAMMFGKDFQFQEGYDYDIAVVYPYNGIPAGCRIRVIDGGIYICEMVVDGFMTFATQIGERIVHIEGDPITEPSQIMDKFNQLLDPNSNLFILRIGIEAPATDNLKNLIRTKINSIAEPPALNIPVPEEVRSIALEMIQTLKTLKEEPKGILKGTKDKTQKEDKHCQINEETKEIAFGVDMVSRLLVKVPPMKTVESEAALKAPEQACKKASESQQ